MSDADDNRKLAELADGLHSIRYPKRMRVLEDTDPLTVRTYYEMASFARRFCEEWLVRRGQGHPTAERADTADGRVSGRCSTNGPVSKMPPAKGGTERSDAPPLAGSRCNSGHQPPPEPVPHVSDHFVPEDEWDGDPENIPF